VLSIRIVVMVSVTGSSAVDENGFTESPNANVGVIAKIMSVVAQLRVFMSVALLALSPLRLFRIADRPHIAPRTVRTLWPDLRQAREAHAGHRSSIFNAATVNFLISSSSEATADHKYTSPHAQ
jgi:hypothetical protein